MVERIRNLNLTELGQTAIFTPSFGGGVFYYITDVIIQCTSASNVNNPASISIGTNAPLYNNIVPITPLMGISTINTFIRIPTNISVPVGIDISIFINVTTPTVGVSQIATVFLEGFYA